MLLVLCALLGALVGYFLLKGRGDGVGGAIVGAIVGLVLALLLVPVLT